MQRLIITADDFGLSRAVNEAVEEAHRAGVLGTASLMVGAEAAADAVERARRNPSLRVGLHVVLVGGTPLSPPGAVPALVDEQGDFSTHLFRAGVNFFFSPGVRRQLTGEVRAQFEAFRQTGLPLDHVNCHNHMHLHPTVGRILLEVGREYGVKAVRFPYEPPIPSWRAARKNLGRRLVVGLFLSPWLSLLKNRIRRFGMNSNHYVFGMNDTGNMDLHLVLRIMNCLPAGVSEIYFHPAARPAAERVGTMKNDRQEEEFAALTSPVLRQYLAESDIQCIGFGDL